MFEQSPPSGMILVHDDGCSISELNAQMERLAIWLPIIAYSEASDTRKIVKAMHEGAIDFLDWPFDIDAFSNTLETIESRSKPIAKAQMRQAAARRRIMKLTPREREVLTYVANGHSSREIGKLLDISPRTVEIHRTNTINKMGVSGTTEAIRIAIEAGLFN